MGLKYTIVFFFLRKVPLDSMEFFLFSKFSLNIYIVKKKVRKCIQRQDIGQTIN